MSVVEITGPQDVPLVTWNDGTKPAAPYSSMGTNGCGNSGYADVVDVEISRNDLEKIGIAIDGSSIFGLRDKNHTYLRNWYDQNVKLLQDMGEEALFSRSGDDKLWFTLSTTYEEFLSKYPLFFWQDRFGRLIRFENLDFILSSGCGKPVIYLYPEKTTDVSVQVMPQGGMTVSDPAYGEGWQVKADPDGRLTLKDGRSYPYLYWEGRGNTVYRIPERGFVIERGYLSKALSDKLSDFGLISQEISDFKEFWLPRMLAENKPYYFITFISRKEIDELAPLAVIPGPDTVIRVLMDYQGLDEPRQVTPLLIKTQKRAGFTVVEWGGVFH